MSFGRICLQIAFSECQFDFLCLILVVRDVLFFCFSSFYVESANSKIIHDLYHRAKCCPFSFVSSVWIMYHRLAHSESIPSLGQLSDSALSLIRKIDHKFAIIPSKFAVYSPKT